MLTIYFILKESDDIHPAPFLSAIQPLLVSRLTLLLPAMCLCVLFLLKSLDDFFALGKKVCFISWQKLHVTQKPLYYYSILVLLYISVCSMYYSVIISAKAHYIKVFLLPPKIFVRCSGKSSSFCLFLRLLCSRQFER